MNTVLTAKKVDTIEDVKTILMAMWQEAKDEVADAKEWGEKDIVQKAYHDQFIIEEVMTRLGWFND